MASIYRDPDPQRTLEAEREIADLRLGRKGARVRWIAGEIGRLDRLIGEWSTRVPDGAPAPPEAVALMVEKERLETELRELAGAWLP